MARITDLPKEVIALVGIHLDKYTIRTAIRTCWRLYNALHHLLWRQLSLPSRSGRLLLSAAKIEENAHRIQQVEFRSVIPQEYCSIRFPHVREITIGHPTFGSTIAPEDWGRHVCVLIGLNPQLRDLVFCLFKSPSSPAIWDTIYASLQTHRRLKVQSSETFSKDLADSFWRACRLFEELELDVHEIDCCETLPTMMFPRLKRLKMTYLGHFRHGAMRTDDHLEWIRNAPNLMALEWSVYHHWYFPTDDLIAALADKTWKHLESFSLLFLFEPDNVWADIISVIPPLKQFRSNNRQFKELSFTSLQKHHFATLRSLHVRDCAFFSSLMTLTVLTECAHLEELRALYIDVADLRSEKLTGRDWVCSGLRFLKVQFFRDMDDAGADELVFKQLSKLEHLKELHIDQLDQGSLALYPAEVGEALKGKGAIQFRLDAGLSLLSTLKRLTHVSFHNTGQRMGAEDVWGILENWTSLEKLVGALSEDAGAQAELEDIIWETSVDYSPFDFFGMFD